MKKRLALALAAVFALSLAACGQAPSSSASAAASSAASQPASAASGEAASGGEIEVDKGLLNVTITLPASFFTLLDVSGDGSYTAQTFADSATDSRLKDVTVHEDGSLSFTVAKSEHKAMMDEMRQQILGSGAELQESFPSVKALEGDDGCTHFTLRVDRAAYENSFDAFALLTVQMQGLMYQAFNGTPDSAVVVEAVDDATGDVIATRDSSEEAEQ